MENVLRRKTNQALHEVFAVKDESIQQKWNTQITSILERGY